jgi:nitrite reductase (NADH) small subunit
VTATRRESYVPICAARDLPPGGRRIVSVPGVGSVGVFNVRGAYYALKNRCPHQGAPLCEGMVTGTTAVRHVPQRMPEADWVREGEIIRCPWHAWEFDILTGRALCGAPWRVATYDVEVAPSDDPPPFVETYPVVEGDGMLRLVLSR